MKHTPKPWMACIGQYHDQEHFAVVQASDSAKVVAFCGVVGADDEAESIANICLIEAAPELRDCLEEVLGLLEALLMIQDREPEPGSIGHRARAALARSLRGEAA